MEEFLRLTKELDDLKRLHKPVMDHYEDISNQMEDISEKIEKSIQEGYTPPSLMEEYDRIGKRWIEIVREKHSILEPILLERDKILDKL